MGLCFATSWHYDDIYAESPLTAYDIREMAMARLCLLVEHGQDVHAVDPTVWHTHIDVRNHAVPRQTVEHEVQATLASLILGVYPLPTLKESAPEAYRSEHSLSRSDHVVSWATPPRVKRSRVAPTNG